MGNPQPLPGGGQPANQTLDANGNGIAQIGPVLPRQHWQIANVSVKCSSNVKEATCSIYVGPTFSSATFMGSTFTGSTGDQIPLGGFDIQPGQFVFAQWSGGDVGATATLVVFGTYTTGAPASFLGTIGAFLNRLIPFFRAGSTVIINGNGVFQYNGPPALGNLIYSSTGAQVTFFDPYGNLVLQGDTNYFFNGGAPNYQAVQRWDGHLIFLQTANGATQAGPYSVNNGNIAPINGGIAFTGITAATIGTNLDGISLDNTGHVLATLQIGNGGALEFTQTDATVITVTTATAVTRITKAYLAKANTANIATHYKLSFSGNGVMGAVAVGFAFVVAIGATGSLDWDMSWPASTLAANNTFQYQGEVEVWLTSTGATANWAVKGWMIITDVTTGNSAIKTLSDTAGNTHDSTVDESIEIDFQWGAVSAGRTISNNESSFHRIGI